MTKLPPAMLITILFCTSLYSQNNIQDNFESKNVISSDTDIAITEKYNEISDLETIAIFKDAINFPTKFNKYVEPYLFLENFPKKNDLDFDDLLSKWIANNPEKIKALYRDRKKAHTKLYGPRPM